MKETTTYREGRKNLLFATLISIPGPILLLLGFEDGAGATQIADFLRRSCEFLSIFLAWILFELAAASENPARQRKLETFVRIFTGLAMTVSGGMMVYLAVAEFGGSKGSVWTSLILAAIGALINARLYLNYQKLENGILSVQAKLHRVKLLLDGWMVLILLLWVLIPVDAVRSMADALGSVSIALYILWSGIRLLREKA